MNFGDKVIVRRVNRRPVSDGGWEDFHGAIGIIEGIQLFEDGNEYYLVRLGRSINGTNTLFCAEVVYDYYEQVHLPKELFEI